MLVYQTYILVLMKLNCIESGYYMIYRSCFHNILLFIWELLHVYVFYNIFIMFVKTWAGYIPYLLILCFFLTMSEMIAHFCSWFHSYIDCNLVYRSVDVLLYIFNFVIINLISENCFVNNILASALWVVHCLFNSSRVCVVIYVVSKVINCFG